MQDFTISSPQSLVAMIPAVLGFQPRQSLIVATVAADQLGATMRVDLGPTLIEDLGQLAELAARQEADSVLAVIVDTTDTDHRPLIAALTAAMAAHSITVQGAVSVPEITAGAAWACIQDECGATGVIDDPRATPMAMAAVLAGRPIFRDRTELASLIDVNPAAVAVLTPILGEPAALDPRDEDAPRRAAEAILAAIDDLEDGTVPDLAALGALAAPLTDVRVRDMMFATALSTRAAAAEQLWLTMARVLPPRYRAEALTLHGYSCYSRGDGPLAGVSFAAALSDHSGHSLARLLDDALQSGASPQVLHSAAESSYRIAEAFGVALPTRRTQTT